MRYLVTVSYFDSNQPLRRVKRTDDIQIPNISCLSVWELLEVITNEMCLSKDIYHDLERNLAIDFMMPIGNQSE